VTDREERPGREATRRTCWSTTFSCLSTTPSYPKSSCRMRGSSRGV